MRLLVSHPATGLARLNVVGSPSSNLAMLNLMCYKSGIVAKLPFLVARAGSFAVRLVDFVAGMADWDFTQITHN